MCKHQAAPCPACSPWPAAPGCAQSPSRAGFGSRRGHSRPERPCGPPPQWAGAAQHLLYEAWTLVCWPVSQGHSSCREKLGCSLDSRTGSATIKRHQNTLCYSVLLGLRGAASVPPGAMTEVVSRLNSRPPAQRTLVRAPLLACVTLRALARVLKRAELQLHCSSTGQGVFVACLRRPEWCGSGISGQILSFVDFPGGSAVRNLPANAGDMDLIPGSGRSPGEGNGNPLQSSCLENPGDGGAWWAAVYGVAKSWIRLKQLSSSSSSSRIWVLSTLADIVK